jgi:hypothetical protein
MIRLFWRQEDDKSFNRWLKKPGGFYLNQKAKKKVMMHTSKCMHYGTGEAFDNGLSRFKLASANREEIIALAEEMRFALERCSDCNP